MCVRQGLLLVVFMHEMVSGLCGWQGFCSGGAVTGEEELRARALQKYTCERQTGHSAYQKTKLHLKLSKSAKENTDLYGINCSKLSTTME